MTQRSRTAFAVRWLAGLAVATGLIFAGSFIETGPAFAAKPAPVPPGKIYHKFHPSAIKSMNGDGSGLADALPAAALNALTPGWTPYVVPCSHLNGGSRWFITTAQTGTYDTYTYPNGTTFTDYPHYDLVAVRMSPVDSTQLDVVQLTDFYGTILIGVETGFWSNDSNEAPSSFAGCGASDLRGEGAFVEDADGTHVDLAYARAWHLRLPVTASEIAVGNFVPYDDTLTDAEIDELLWPIYGGPYNRQATTSPGGDLAVAYNQKRLLIVLAAAPDYNSPVRVLCDGNIAGAPQPMNQQQWSPDGLTIAFADTNGNIWIVPASGGDLKKILAGTSTSKYTVPIWSPDSQYVVAGRDDYLGTTVAHKYLVRVPAGGGTIVTLREIGTTGGPALRWVPSN